MSKFLGPVHFWLHNKIKLQDQMETLFIDAFEGSAPAELKFRLEELNEVYGTPDPEENLEDHIDTGNIHGWLQKRIADSETRFAAKYQLLSREFGTEVLDTAIVIASKTGEKGAKEALQSGAYDGGLAGAFKLLNNYILEGMPCDQASAVTGSSAEELVWQSSRCLHKAYWNIAGGDVETHYRLRDAFNEAFFKEIDGLSYVRDNTNGLMTYKITRNTGRNDI